jgi:hypothetical protein
LVYVETLQKVAGAGAFVVLMCIVALALIVMWVSRKIKRVGERKCVKYS